jgi:hypothetical protein
VSHDDKDQEQPRLFDPARYSPVSVAIWQKLPEGNARAFAIASALGSIRDRSGSSNNLRAGKDAAGVLVTSKRLPAILTAIGINRRQWQKHVVDWEQRYVAHRCGRGTVCLFTRPTLLDCPVCNERIEIDHMPPHVKTPPRGFAKRTDRVQESAHIGDFRRTGSAHAGAHLVREFEPNSDTPENRSLQGLGKGMGGTEEGEVVPTGISDDEWVRLSKADRDAFKLAAQFVGNETQSEEVP